MKKIPVVFDVIRYGAAGAGVAAALAGFYPAQTNGGVWLAAGIGAVLSLLLVRRLHMV